MLKKTKRLFIILHSICHGYDHTWLCCCSNCCFKQHKNHFLKRLPLFIFTYLQKSVLFRGASITLTPWAFQTQAQWSNFSSKWLFIKASFHRSGFSSKGLFIKAAFHQSGFSLNVYSLQQTRQPIDDHPKNPPPNKTGSIATHHFGKLYRWVHSTAQIINLSKQLALFVCFSSLFEQTSFTVMVR